MLKRPLSESRRFSLKNPLREPLLQGDTIAVFAINFEGGQRYEPQGGEAVFQVLEGEATFTSDTGVENGAKGQVLIGAPTLIENRAGGLLVVLETRNR
jgi:hypothetical protein